MIVNISPQFHRCTSSRRAERSKRDRTPAPLLHSPHATNPHSRRVRKHGKDHPLTREEIRAAAAVECVAIDLAELAYQLALIHGLVRQIGGIPRIEVNEPSRREKSNA